jgi:hypothetical protein
LIFYFLKVFKTPQLERIIPASGNQIVAVWRESDGLDEITVALQRIYLLLPLYAPELDCIVMAA